MVICTFWIELTLLGSVGDSYCLLRHLRHTDLLMSRKFINFAQIEVL